MSSATDRESFAAELARHAEEEGEILGEYRKLSDALPEGPLAFLVDRILTEEEMHHFLLTTLAGWLREPPGSGAPQAASGFDPEAVLRQTRALQDHEQKTVAACRELKSRLAGDELAEALLDALALDSEKHHRLLAAVEALLA